MRRSRRGDEDEESQEDEEELHRVRTFFMQMLQNHFTIDEILQMHPEELQNGFCCEGRALTRAFLQLQQGPMKLVDAYTNVGALIIRIGFWGPFYYNI